MTDYKKYALGQVENFLYDAMSSGATPQEIYDTIRGVVEDNYYTYKKSTSEAYELLGLLNGNGKGHLSCDKDDISTKYKGTWDSFCGKSDYHVSVAPSATQREIDLMPPWGHSDMEALQYTEEEIGEMCAAAELEQDLKNANEFLKEDKVVKWVLPVDDNGVLIFPEDLLEAANLKEGDKIEWIPQDDQSCILRKV